jgi:hypothetical protein
MVPSTSRTKVGARAGTGGSISKGLVTWSGTHVAGFNLGILMRALFGPPKEAAGVKNALVFVVPSDVALALVILAVIDGAPSMLVIIIAPETH